MSFIPPAPTLPPESTSAKPASVMVVPHYEVQWNRPVFKAPALVGPEPTSLTSAFPTAAHFRPKAKSSK